MPSCFESQFASPERASLRDILRCCSAVGRLTCRDLIDCLPHPVMVLNRCRQLVFGNRALADLLALADLEPALGKRPGELFGCIHAQACSGGCGTSGFCRECGAVQVILDGLAGQVETRECHMLRRWGGAVEALDLRVHAAPLDVEGEACIVFSVLDISHERRRRVLERIFFHDILNSAGGIRGLLSILHEDAPEPLVQDITELCSSVETMLEEIYSQRDLLAAEHGDLIARPQELVAGDVLRQAAERYSRDPLSRRRTVVLGCCPEETLVSDPVLLGRILGNMLKNALEAVAPGETVYLGGEASGEAVRFFVRNPGRMDEAAAHQVFKRSFSTKGQDRGLGTYSMRLLAERYLGGSVGFRTGGGMVEFAVTLPRRGPAKG